MRKIRKTKLSAGGHLANEPKHCAMEYINKEIFGHGVNDDHPMEVDYRIARVVRTINDALSHEPRQRLQDYLERIATCAPLNLDEQANDKFTDLYEQVRVASNDIYLNRTAYEKTFRGIEEAIEKRLFNLLEATLNFYDQVAGTSWEDRPLPEIPPVMEQLEQAVPYSAGGVVTTANVSAAWMPVTPYSISIDMSSPYISAYEPSMKAKFLTKVEETKEKYFVSK